MRTSFLTGALLASALSLVGIGALAQPVNPTPPPAPAPPRPAPGVAPAPPPTADAEAPAEEAAEPEAEPDSAPDGDAPGGVEPTEPPPPLAPTPGPGLAPMPGLAPSSDVAATATTTPPAKAAAAEPTQIFAEDWWSHARPILELHGYFRLRAELFHQFSLARVNTPSEQLWPWPLDHYYSAVGRSDPSADFQAAGQYGAALCTGKEAKVNDDKDPTHGLYACRKKSQAGANLRFRLNPELHVSDNLRVLTQIDLLDNVVMGSTPQGYALEPDINGGYASLERGGYNPIGVYDLTQEPPASGVNGTRDSIRVKRVWAEYQTPVGELRFGRMPSHWGLGILQNSGDGFDDDYQTTVDRVMFVTGIKALDLYFAAGWDFPNEGATSESVLNPQAQPYDASQLDDVRQYMFSVARRRSPDLVQKALGDGKLVLNGGAYLLMRRQRLANDLSGSGSDGAFVPGAFPGELLQQGGVTGYVRRQARFLIPDLWVQLLYDTFRFEAELATVQGRMLSTDPLTGKTPDELEDHWFRMWGFATETEFRAMEDKLKLDFKAGWASGDPEAETQRDGAGGLVPGAGEGIQDQIGDDTWSTFAFHPAYRVDLILHRNLLSRVQGTYYFRPGIQYDFMHTPDGQRVGGGFSAIWTRASSFLQTPGHRRDLGIELNGKLYFQAKDGALNDVPGAMGGFYTQLEYGVLFPLGGLGYQEREAADIRRTLGDEATDTKAAQILRWYLGVLF